MNKRNLILIFAQLLPAIAFAQDLNTQITVDHEVVPEERAATRLRLLPKLSLPKVDVTRLPVASRFVQAELSPFINPLGPTEYLTQAREYPWRGYAMLGFGPVYNLDASLGYRFVDTRELSVDGFLQFNGMSYTRGYAGLPEFMGDYTDKACFRRQAVLGGANSSWTTAAGALNASVMYQYQGYTFPILQLQQPPVTEHNNIDASRAKVNLQWASKVKDFDYTVGADYSMVYLGKGNATNNRGILSAGGKWHSSSKSVVGVDLRFSLDNSALVGYKGILHILPRYSFSVSTFKVGVGVDVDIKTGNCPASNTLLVAPDLNLVWQPSAFFNIWGKISGRMDDNFRGAILNEQPYLLADFDAGISRIYDGELGLTVGPFRGFALQLFGGYTIAQDWYMPAIETGYMAPMDVKGFRWGASVSYDWRRFLSIGARLDMAQSPRGDYECGYALWRDHAKLNLTTNVVVRPIDKLEIGLNYHLRSGREKTLGADRNLNLRNISNLSASVNYNITPQWSAFVRGENLLNKNWYLGPAVPCQGIMGMIGASYKF